MTVVGLAQIGSRPGETEANRDRSLDAARRLFEQGADIVVLPELTVPWYGTDPARIAPLAEPLDGPTVTAWQSAAAAGGGMVVGGFCERDGDRLCVPGGQRLRGAALAVPGDLSAAAFFIVGALIAPGSELELPGVGVNPRRDGALRILRRMGAAIEAAPRPDAGGEPVADLRVRAGALAGIEVEPELAPAAIDEFPILCIAAACARGATTFAGVGELRVKESDRIAAMADGLAALGVAVETGGDWMRVHGGGLGGGAVDSRADHRVAMAFAVAALAAAGPVRVRDPGWVASSFPGFAAQARAAGLRLSDA